jgi:uncharacterized protein YegL
MSNYDNIQSLERISEIAIQKIGDNPHLINFNLKVSFGIELISCPLSDVTETALDFQMIKCPDGLHMNHGEYIHKKNNGIEEVINRLKTNPTSNRAIISLINQEDIVDSGDSPIPSFMIIQFAIENTNEMYVTVYFRALEVSNFLRINTEEIRQIIEIVKKDFVDLSEIKLNILAFKAYDKNTFNSLIKFKIDTLDQIEIQEYLFDNKIDELIKMLEEKKEFSTVIKYKSFENILKWIEVDNKKASPLLNKKLRSNLSINLLKEIVSQLKELERLRTKNSHHPVIEEKQVSFEAKVDQLIGIL